MIDSCQLCHSSIHREHTVAFPTCLAGTISSLSNSLWDYVRPLQWCHPWLFQFLPAPHSLCSDVPTEPSIQVIPGIFPSFSLRAGAVPLPCLIPTALSTWDSVTMWQPTEHSTTHLNYHSSVGYLLPFSFFFIFKFGTNLPPLSTFTWLLQWVSRGEYKFQSITGTFMPHITHIVQIHSVGLVHPHMSISSQVP